MTPRLELVHEAPKAQARQAPALLFVHGAFCGAWCWQQHFMPWFAQRGFDCWAFSFEGHGASEGREYLAASSIEDYRRNLSRIIAQFDTPPILVGHSMGCFVIQHYLHHSALPGVALLAPVPATGMGSASLRLMTQAPDLFMGLNMFQQGQYTPGAEDIKRLLFSEDVPDDTLELMARNCQTESHRAVMDMTLANFLSLRDRPSTPALILGASNDQLIAHTDVEITAQSFNVNAEILPHASHMMMLDTRWEQVAERILTWLNTLEPCTD